MRGDVLNEITDTVRELGRRHVSYSIRPEHYSTVGASLLWALEQTLRAQRWTDKVEAAWKSVHTILMSVMLEAIANVSSHFPRLIQTPLSPAALAA
ncbi:MULTISPECIES: globin domain-containing protein [Nostoc]|uniref:Globin domain-containing protein n=2 Tax=Nostoc TaxID=1177 RepID=A0ABR8I8A6_9NOSO|nr:MULTISPECIES: globin domain-containing protein [Nostoc]MBD2563715.1 hypothetical protein [Nostoc linckia FACHB-391]MBD2647136.1 hypothetical protein [Nostoc foliaceum FACHB-393]